MLEETLYATYDANFNIIGLVQENQTFVERYVYTPFGDRTVLPGTFGSRSSTSYDRQPGHQGLRIDTESGRMTTGLDSFTRAWALSRRVTRLERSLWTGRTSIKLFGATLSHSEIRRGWAR